MPIQAIYKNEELSDAQLDLSTVSNPLNANRFDGLQNKSDRDIWNMFVKGNESAFIFIYSNNFNGLAIFGEQFSDDVSVIEDAIQDIFIDLRKKRSSLPPIRHSIKAYLYKCLRNKILEYRRKSTTASKNINQYHRDFELDASIEDRIIQDQKLLENKQAVIASINKLPVRQREVVHHLFYENMTYEEIREVMALDNVKSARNLVYKALNKLRSSLNIAYILLIISVV